MDKQDREVDFQIPYITNYYGDGSDLSVPKFMQDGNDLHDTDYFLSKEEPEEVVDKKDAKPRKKMQVKEVKQLNKADLTKAVAAAVATGLIIVGAHKVDNAVRVNEAMGPVKEYTSDLINDNIYRLNDSNGVDAGYALNEGVLADAMDNKFKEMPNEGNIYLGELAKEIPNQEYNMGKVLKSMDEDYTMGATSMEEYAKMLGYDNFDDFYRAQGKEMLKLSEEEKRKEYEGNGPKL